MAPSRRRLLAAMAASASIAGCVSDGDSGDDSDGGGDDGGGDGMDGGSTDGGGTSGDGGGSGDGSSDGGTNGGAVTVETAQHDQLGEILVDGDGMTLYMFDPDPQGEGSSTCTDSCAQSWPPLTTDGEPSTGSGVSASLSTFDRADGSTQVAANGWPLYYWQGDSEPGDATGQGVQGVWWVLRPDGTPVRPTVKVREHSELGNILVDGQGMTLYMFDSDTQGSGSSTCSGGCADNWPPLSVEDGTMAGSNVEAELTTFEREDGSTQVAANGWPLYYWQGDSEPGDATGQGVQDVWWVLDPSGAPIRGSGGSSSGGGSSDGSDGSTDY